MDASIIIPILIALLVVFVIAKGVRIVQQSEAMVIERLRRYHEDAHRRLQYHHPDLR